MRIFTGVFLLLHTFAAFSQTTFPVNGPQDERNFPHYLTHATVHVDSKTVLKNATVKFHRGKIVEVGTELSPGEGAVVMDVSGKHIYPAFIDLYTDYGLPTVESAKRPDKPQYDRSENLATSWNDALHPHYHAKTQFQPAGEKADRWLKAGFGTVLTHRHDGIARGAAALVAPGAGLANELLMKSAAASFFSFKKGSSTQKYPSSLMGAIALLRQTEYDARWYAQSGSEEERNIALAAWNENQPLPQIFAITEKNDIPRVHAIGEEFEKQFIIKSVGDEYQRIDEVVRTGYPLIVPVNFPKAYDVSDPYEAQLVSLQELKHWESAPSNPARLAEHGVPFCFTMDGCEKPEDFFANIRKAVNYGLDTAAAIDALTINPAKFIGVDEQMGSLTAGKWANFIVTSGDLFDAETEILETWVTGQMNRHVEHNMVDIRGHYNINIDNHFYALEVSGKNRRDLKSRIEQVEDGDTTHIEVKLSVQEKLISLSFNPKDDHYNKVLRLAGNIHKDSRIWEGRAQTAGGDWLPWTAIRQKQKLASAGDKPDRTEVVDRGSVRLPNRAYGLDSVPAQQSIWFTGATVWTSAESGVIENGEVLIHNGKILAVGKRLDIPALLPKTYGEVKEINLRGKHLTPGIIDEHSHIAISRGVNEGTTASSAEVRISDALNPDDINIFRQLAGGVTTIQQLHGSANPIGGQSSIIKLRWGQPARGLAFENATPFIKFALGENVKQSNWGDRETVRYPQTRMGVEQVFYDHFLRAREYDQKWQAAKEEEDLPFWKRILPKNQKKPKPNLRVDLGLEALAEILNHERFITCHSYVQSEINMLMHVADSLNFTVNTFTHILEGYKVADKMREHGAGGSTFSDWWAYKYEVSDAIPYNAALMHEQGVLVAINSDDAEMARRLNQEAAKAVKYGGVSEEEALKMVTINPAKLMRIDDRVGSIQAGKDADLVVWSEHPLSIYSLAEQTYIDGRRYFDRRELDEIVKRDQAERARILSKMIEDPGKKAGKPSSENPNDKEYHCDDVDEEI